MRGRGRPSRASSAVSPPGHSSAARASAWHIARQSTRRATVRFDCSTHTAHTHTRAAAHTAHNAHSTHATYIIHATHVMSRGLVLQFCVRSLTRFTPLLVPQGKHIRSTVNDGRRRMEDNAKGCPRWKWRKVNTICCSLLELSFGLLVCPLGGEGPRMRFRITHHSEELGFQ